MNSVKNPNCDNDKCTRMDGEVRLLPAGGGGNIILCRSCFDHEIRYRTERNQQLPLDSHFPLPRWDDLKPYGGDAQ